MSNTFRQITPTDKFGWHLALLEVYERLLCPLEEMKSRGKLLEIGTDGGGGLAMYADRFSRWNIYGIDINPTPEHLIGQNRITHLVGNAYDETTLNRFENGSIDIIIDDGPHSIESQEWFARNYPQLLTPYGVAIIEDVQQPDYIQRLGACVPEGFIGYGIDLRHVNGRYDDLLFVIHRK